MGKLFKEKRKRGFSIMFALVGFGLLAALSYGGYMLWKLDQSRIITIQKQANAAVDAAVSFALQSKVAKLQDELMHDLSINCEVRGAKEPDAIIVFDSNSEASIGRFQFQIKTVQHYVKVFESRDITRHEAIQIAIDKSRATELARQILFKEKDGVRNWINCGNKLGLRERIKIINSL